jgi:hypothetical protein
MKRVFVAAVLAALIAPAHADKGDEHWFRTGEAWYQHPCGLQAFAKYGHDDSPEVWRAYEITKQHPELCSKLFP